MHEYSITESMLTLVLDKAREAGAGKVTRVNLVLGELSGVVGDCVRQYFEILARDTIAGGAELSCAAKPARLKCRGCRNEFTPADHDWTCPACREVSVEIVSGRECYLESIEVE
jgi:hydrogenase nickel incorporation protein HypA/HybF